MRNPAKGKAARLDRRGLVRTVQQQVQGTPTVATADEMLAIAWAYFGPRWMAGVPRILYPADDEYVCPTVAEALGIVQASRVDRDQYFDGGFDCDDFAYTLKAHVCEAAYVEGTRRRPYCFGILWAARPAHALNWMINDDGLLRLVEPQRGEVVPLAKYTQLYLALI